jgi:hypothetical protein
MSFRNIIDLLPKIVTTMSGLATLYIAVAKIRRAKKHIAKLGTSGRSWTAPAGRADHPRIIGESAAMCDPM